MHSCLQHPCIADTKDTEIPGSRTFAKILVSSDAAVVQEEQGSVIIPLTLFSELIVLTPLKITMIWIAQNTDTFPSTNTCIRVLKATPH